MLNIFAGREGDAYALLAHALRRVYGLETMPEIARLPGGKPYFPTAPHIHFNLSHSGSFVLCAVGDGPVGVDVETPRPRHARLPAFALSPAEHAAYLRAGGTWEAFYDLWTRKEAWCKFTGLGIPGRPGTAEVPPEALLRSGGAFGCRWAVCAGETPPEPQWTRGYSCPL